ncbi:hypothetical protein QVD17_01632 [Tagetes erecta]|uniref:DUF4378 domain-containing protein n=1 Tax=Tagetes erecta TaxID=13708 RepID=A0AAD8L575_TARER|nr:hypothetical protein QVD17_01632 [Tagetes erecta]
MAAKILHSLTDDNPDLQRQIGCMTGVFQLFDRHQIVAGRRFSGHSPKRLPLGSSQLYNGTPEHESSNSYQRPYSTEKYSNKIVPDKNRASTESSRDSFSSMSRSSSFSSLDCNINNKTSHQEPDQIVFPETPSRDSLTRQSRQTVDLRDVIKDSMYKHTPTVKEDGPDHVVDYRESLDALAKFQESSWYCNEPREFSRSKSYQLRDGSSFSVPKDCPRFSYDERETNRLPFQSRDNPKAVISKQLEGRESSNSSIRNLESDDVISADRGPIQSRPPSVVAKLMGLEALPDSSSSNQKDSGLGHFGPIKIHNSSRSSPREPTSPLWRNTEMKPVSRFPLEPAPWKQRDGARSPQRPVSRTLKSPTIIHSPFSSVYSEVDKRLKHLEFTQSGKDLRALKQILEAMQSIETRKEGTQTIVKRQPISTQNERFTDRQNSRGSNSLRAYESPIVIMKPAKLVERLGMPVEDFLIDDKKVMRNNIPKSTRRENTVNAAEVRSGGRYTRTTIGMSKQQLNKENATTSGKSSGSISPRLSQKRPELERRARPPTPPVDSNKSRKQSPKQGSELSSPGGRRSKYSNIQQSDNRGRNVKVESKNPSYKDPQVSSEEVDNMQSPISIHEKSTLLARELPGPEYPSPVSVLDDGVYTDNSPSPVKYVLKTPKDDANQGIKDQWQAPDDVIPDTLSSGTTSKINRKKLQDIHHLVQKLTRLNSGLDEAHTTHIACENTKPDDMYISEILLASGLLLRDLGSNLTTFSFHSSGHPINPELFLVIEQTKFSSLTKQEPNTPEKIIKKEKTHRKLIFDAVNEILARKLALSVPCQKSFKLVKKTFNAQKLLMDLCLEIEQLQLKEKYEDISLEEEDDGLKNVLWLEVLNRAESWTDYDAEIPVITLEVERLIFKDLVNEVVLGEAADGRRIKPGRRCRQLFSK